MDHSTPNPYVVLSRLIVLPKYRKLEGKLSLQYPFSFSYHDLCIPTLTKQEHPLRFFQSSSHLPYYYSSCSTSFSILSVPCVPHFFKNRLIQFHFILECSVHSHYFLFSLICSRSIRIASAIPGLLIVFFLLVEATPFFNILIPFLLRIPFLLFLIE